MYRRKVSKLARNDYVLFPICSSVSTNIGHESLDLVVDLAQVWKGQFREDSSCTLNAVTCVVESIFEEAFF